jgi:two-component system chemotaxis response regulator CheB
MSGERVRTLVVDDSAFARKVLREALASDPRIEVVGFARDGLEALETIGDLKPDVVTLDLMMPHLDGIGVLKELASMKSRSKVVVVSISGEESEVVVHALQLGAVELVRKPTALATDRLYELSGDLIRAVLNAASARPPRSLPPPATAPAPTKRVSNVELVAVGASTGGPHALTVLISSLPADLPVPMVIGLHIPGEYTEAMASRLNSSTPLDVVEASDGLPLRPGLVVIAKGGMHLKLERYAGRIVTRLSQVPRESLYFPSIDVLFKSAVGVAGGNLLGVVLTGMGDDGCKGARAIVEAGGSVLTETEESCVVYGMPRAVREAGYSAGQAGIEEMAAAIARRL